MFLLNWKSMFGGSQFNSVDAWKRKREKKTIVNVVLTSNVWVEGFFWRHIFFFFLAKIRKLEDWFCFCFCFCFSNDQLKIFKKNPDYHQRMNVKLMHTLILTDFTFNLLPWARVSFQIAIIYVKFQKSWVEYQLHFLLDTRRTTIIRYNVGIFLPDSLL